MQCPVCDEKPREIEKYGVMIDSCPGCKGKAQDGTTTTIITTVTAIAARTNRVRPSGGLY